MKIREFREGISVKFGASIVLLSVKSRAMRQTVIANIRLDRTKIRLKTKVLCRLSTFDELLMRGRMKETKPKA